MIIIQTFYENFELFKKKFRISNDDVSNLVLKCYGTQKKMHYTYKATVLYFKLDQIISKFASKFYKTR